MTIVGKILVFVILLFSLGIGAMCLVVYITHVNHSEALKKSLANQKVDVANMGAYKAEYEALLKQKQDEEARWKTEHERVTKLLEAQLVVNKEQAEAANIEEKKRSDKFDALYTAAQTEVAKRQQDVEKLRGTLKEEMDKTIKLVQVNNELRERTTGAEIQSRTLLEINRRIETQMQELARDNARMKTNMGATTTTVVRTGKNPPPEQIEGLITTTDPSGLFKISLGSDAGLVRGHTMEVFRVDRQNPLRSKYLGTVRIIDVRTNEAVAQPVGKMLDMIKVGDEVASRILGG